MCIEFSQHGPVSELVALTGTWRATLKKTCKWPSGDAVSHRACRRCESKVSLEFLAGACAWGREAASWSLCCCEIVIVIQ
jgi:hypothetical protein